MCDRAAVSQHDSRVCTDGHQPRAGTVTPSQTPDRRLPPRSHQTEGDQRRHVPEGVSPVSTSRVVGSNRR